MFAQCLLTFHLVIFSLVALSCPTLCNPMDGSTPGFPGHHQLPELAQIHVHQVGDTIQPSHALLFPSPPLPVSQLLASGGQTIDASASTSVLPMNIQD